MPITGLKGTEHPRGVLLVAADNATGFRAPACVTSRCYLCDTFFEARTAEAARSLLESHQAREHAPRRCPFAAVIEP
jgi:hypothetical protein